MIIDLGTPGQVDADLFEKAVTRYLARCTWNGDCLEGSSPRYGCIRLPNKGIIGAHRASYIAHHGPIPPGLLVRHTCDNPPCVNPKHLLVGTVQDNSNDMCERGRALTGLKVNQATVPPEVIRAAVEEYLREGHSQASMAQRLGVTHATFGRWVRGEYRADSGVVGVVIGHGHRPAAALKPCGTRAGYNRHRSAGEAPCEPCAEANRAYHRGHRRRAREAIVNPEEAA